ncbi:MAG TPA: carboxymuconolactone decarboxylase family protein [Propionibacteriaceae bacterium]
MSEDTPVLDTLEAITAVSIELGTLEAREHMLVRLAALVAVDAPAGSYLLNLGAAVDVGVTLEDVQGVLIAVAPVVGTTRIVSAAENVAEAFGIVVAIAEAEAEAEEEALEEAEVIAEAEAIVEAEDEADGEKV